LGWLSERLTKLPFNHARRTSQNSRTHAWPWAWGTSARHAPARPRDVDAIFGCPPICLGRVLINRSQTLTWMHGPTSVIGGEADMMRTWRGRDGMSANDPKRTCSAALFGQTWKQAGGTFGPPAYFDVFNYCPAWLLIASSTWAFTASRLKLAGACIGGKSMAVFASSATLCCTDTKRQNSRAKKSFM